MATYFTADHHLSHPLVAKLRGFTMIDRDGIKVADTLLHDMQLAENWDAVVKDDDDIYLLGDMSLNSGPQVAAWLDERKGRKHLISGNHDKTHSKLNRKAEYLKKLTEWNEVFDSIQDELTLTIAGKPVTLSHFPYWSWGDGPNIKDENFVPKYKDVRPRETKTSILLHGHVHTEDTIHERSMHVGLDGWNLQLVPLSAVEEFVSSL